jgi:hypothetical protein
MMLNGFYNLKPAASAIKDALGGQKIHITPTYLRPFFAVPLAEPVFQDWFVGRSSHWVKVTR